MDIKVLQGHLLKIIDSKDLTEDQKKAVKAGIEALELMRLLGPTFKSVMETVKKK